MNTGSRINLGLTTVLLSASFAAPAQAAGVLAGVLIENTAQASYTSNATPQTVSSNTVTLRVDEVLDVATVSQESGAVPATSNAVLRFRVTNTGNGPEAFSLTADPAVAGNAVDMVIDGLAIDVNGNGVVDAGDITLANGATSAVLPADGPIDVLVLVTVPSAAASGVTSRVSLSATATTGSGTAGTVFAGAGLNGGDAVVGASTARRAAEAAVIVQRAQFALLKSATVADPFGGTRPVPGAIITYRIVANVTGTGSIDGLSVTDAIPANSSYEPGTLRLESTTLSDAVDGDAGQASATGIAVQIGTLTGGAQRTISFQVKIK